MQSCALKAWIFRFLAKAQNDKIFAILICLTEHSFCHTERNEVSINLKRFKRLLKVFRLNRRFKLNSHKNKVSKLLQHRPSHAKLEIKIFRSLSSKRNFCFCALLVLFAKKAKFELKFAPPQSADLKPYKSGVLPQ